MRNHIEWQRMSKNLILCNISFTTEYGSCTLYQFIHSWLACSRGSLVCRHDHLTQTKKFVQWPNRHESNGSGTIRVGNQLLSFGSFGVDFRDYQWDSLFVTECRRVINHNRSIVPSTDILRMLQTKVTIYSQKHHITLSCRILAKQLNCNLSKLGVHLFAGTTLRSKDAKVVYGEVTLFKTSHDFFTDCSSGTNDAYVEGSTGHHGE
mmetsp:Transcript_2214/g.4992  ORF Transcript_2214/g.4992 Transcript_2214/m.4992 type:complete len:207 (-) Transcript_2214:211-831(-)